MSKKYQEVFYDVFIHPFRSKLGRKPDANTARKEKNPFTVGNANGATLNAANHPETKDPAAAGNQVELRDCSPSQRLLPVDK